ncbi:hypothetical protein ACFL1A_00775 [Patescibacteria group bacterium]
MVKIITKQWFWIILLIVFNFAIVVRLSSLNAQYAEPTDVICDDGTAYEGECCTQTSQCEQGCWDEGSLSGSCLAGSCYCTTPPSATLPYSECDGDWESADGGWLVRTCECDSGDPDCNPYEIMCDPAYESCGEDGGGDGDGGGTPLPTAPPGSTVTPPPPTVPPGSTITPFIGNTPTLPPGVTPLPTVPPGSTVTPPPPTVPPGSTITPIPPSTQISMVITAVQLPGPVYNFSTILANSSNTVPGATFTIAGATSSEFTLNSGPTYTVSVNPVTNWEYMDIFWSWDLSSDFNRGNLDIDTVGQSGNLFVFVVFGQGEGWLQTVTGDVYSRANYYSPVPFVAPAEYFSLDGLGGYPGAVTYGGGAFDFLLGTGSGVSSGSNTLSTTRWLANNINNTSITSASFYDHYYVLLGAPTTPTPWSNPLGKGEIDNCPDDICYIVGNPDINNSITINSGEKFIVIVTGSLDINADIRVNDGGFLAFIVSGNIGIDDSVGRSPASYSSGVRGNVEGIYISDGTITVEGPGTGGNEQFVGRGMFIADNVVLERDLGPGTNLSYPSELFVFNPRYLIEMPEALKELPIRWEEVEP